MFENILESIEKLDETSRIDLNKLKFILNDTVFALNNTIKEKSEIQSYIELLLSLLINKSIINQKEKDELNKQLNYIKIKEQNTNIDNEIIKNNSLYKGVFYSLEELFLKYPADKCQHGFRALISSAKSEDVRKKDDIKEYVFDIDLNNWILTQDKTIMTNFTERIDTEILGRENGSPLDSDFIVYKKLQEKFIPYTKDELDIASRSLLHKHLSNMLVVNKVNNRITIPSKATLESNSNDIVNNNNDFFKEYVKNNYNISYEEFEKIITQINNDYNQKIIVEYITDINGLKRPYLYRTSTSKNADGNYIEDYDEYGIIRKNTDNKTIDDLINIINKDFSRSIIVEENNSRISNTLGVTTETTIDKDKNIPYNISKNEINKIITQINNDYNNSISSIKEQPYNNMLNFFVNSLPITSEEKTGMISRLSKPINVFDMYVEGVDYTQLNKNKNITMEVLNNLFSAINGLMIKLDINQDEIFNRENIFLADKIFDKSITVNKQLLVKGLCQFNSDLIVKGKLQVEGNEIYFNNLSSITKINSINTIFKDKIVDLNKPADLDEEHQASNTDYDNWVNIIGNGISGIKVFRGRNNLPFFIGYDESRKSLVSGFITNETETAIADETSLVLNRADILEDGKALVYDYKTNKAITLDTFKADIEGNICKTITLDNDLIDSSVLLYSAVRINSDGKLIASNSSTLDNATVLGIVVNIKEHSETQTTLKIVLFGIIRGLNLPGANINDSVFLDENGLLVTSINKNNNTKYIVKHLGKVISANQLFFNQSTAAEYLPQSYTAEEEALNYSPLNIDLSSYFTDSEYSYLKPVGATSDTYDIFSIAIHGLLGLKGFMIKNNENKIVLADNGKLVDISSIILFSVKLNDNIYLTNSNTFTIEPTQIKIGVIVGVNLMKVDIELISNTTENNIDTSVIINATSNEKQDLLINTFYKINIDDYSVEELTFIEPSSPNFNKLYIMKNNGVIYIKDITLSKTMGTFYKTATQEVYYKPLFAQKSIFKNSLTSVSSISDAITETIPK